MDRMGHLGDLSRYIVCDCLDLIFVQLIDRCHLLVGSLDGIGDFSRSKETSSPFRLITFTFTSVSIGVSFPLFDQISLAASLTQPSDLHCDLLLHIEL